MLITACFFVSVTQFQSAHSFQLWCPIFKAKIILEKWMHTWFVIAETNVNWKVYFPLFLRLHWIFRIIHTRLITCAKKCIILFVFVSPSVIMYSVILVINSMKHKKLQTYKRWYISCNSALYCNGIFWKYYRCQELCNSDSFSYAKSHSLRTRLLQVFLFWNCKHKYFKGFHCLNAWIAFIPTHRLLRNRVNQK